MNPSSSGPDIPVWFPTSQHYCRSFAERKATMISPSMLSLTPSPTSSL